MCGIVGYAGRRDALPILLDGLKRLEYRGYDSAGVAIVGSALQVMKDKGFIANLEAQLPPLKGSTGFAHTRWATHGAPSKVNAHPHVDCTGKIALAHNGIIENYASLREKLQARGHTFVSQTDTESLVHLIESYYDGDLETATRKALGDIRGSYAILVVHADEPGKVIGARNESPLVVGIGPDENFLASDGPALLRYTDRVAYVMDREMVVITPKGVTIKDLEGHVVKREPQRITWSLEDAGKGGASRRLQDPCDLQRDRIEPLQRGRQDDLHAGRNRDRRRRDEDVHRTACRPVPDRNEARPRPRDPRVRRARPAQGSAPLPPAGGAVRAEQGGRDSGPRAEIWSRGEGHVLHRAPRELPGRDGRGPEDEGDLVHSRRGVRGGRTEAWAARPPDVIDAGDRGRGPGPDL